MKRDTRQEILEAARELFNERGFNAVSIRDIAQTLGISKGNLTYHFKKKEEIIEAILAETKSTPPPEAPTSLEELDAFFQDVQQAVSDNAFYFWHYAQLSQLSSKIREKQREMYRSNFDKYMRAFSTLQAEGSLRKENFAGEYNNVIDILILSSIYWIPFCEVKQADFSHESFQHHAWMVLYPLLTDKGKKAAIGKIW